MNAPRILARSLVVLLAACGYSVGYADYGASSRTVAITVAGNHTLRQRLEVPLTRALEQLLPTHSNLIPASFDRADTILEVDIVEVRGRNLVPGSADVSPIKEGSLDYAVDVRLLDGPTGRPLREERVYDRAEFRVPVGQTDATAIAEASFDLARKIALSLEDDPQVDAPGRR